MFTPNRGDLLRGEPGRWLAIQLGLDPRLPEPCAETLHYRLHAPIRSAAPFLHVDMCGYGNWSLYWPARSAQDWWNPRCAAGSDS